MQHLGQSLPQVLWQASGLLDLPCNPPLLHPFHRRHDVRRGTHSAICAPVGIANPMEADIRRFRSLVSDRAITQKVISPGFRSFSPSLSRDNFAIGRKDRRHTHKITCSNPCTPARLLQRRPVFLDALPTPRVKNICVGTIAPPFYSAI